MTGALLGIGLKMLWPDTPKWLTAGVYVTLGWVAVIAFPQLASELGPKGIRVHAISPGPLATRAASGIPHFDEMLDRAREKAPARKLVSIDDVGSGL